MDSLSYRLVAAVLGLAALVLPHWFGDSSGSTEKAWLLSARYTARFSFCLFVLAFVSSSLPRLSSSALWRTLRRSRRDLGIAFGIVHLIHLAALTKFFVTIDNWPGVDTLIIGGLGYLVLIAMLATSNDAAVRRLGTRWTLLHKYGSYYLAFVFGLTYAMSIYSGDKTFAGTVGLLVTLAAIAVRTAANYANRT